MHKVLLLKLYTITPQSAAAAGVQALEACWRVVLYGSLGAGAGA